MKQTMQQKPQQELETARPNLTGIPTQMKQDFETRSGLSFDDVRVHYHSDKPAQLQALAYTQGAQVYIGPGQERHLRHELGHVVQQKRGVVKPTKYINTLPVNDSITLEREADCGIGEIDSSISPIQSLAYLGGSVAQRMEGSPNVFDRFNIRHSKEFFYAYDNNKQIGYLQYEISDNVLTIITIANTTGDDYSGVGSVLLYYAADMANKKGIEKIHVTNVAFEATAFYIKLGFSPIKIEDAALKEVIEMNWKKNFFYIPEEFRQDWEKKDLCFYNSYSIYTTELIQNTKSRKIKALKKKEPCVIC